ncbi:hypothetical protein [Brachyspira innocens]|uniref:hypothetical protein n=1 Tax=Brachyspira innocens TaxID=13264 RepID=UPI0026EF545C|nr:hypothetical protein [Brachyspira innocens]
MLKNTKFEELKYNCKYCKSFRWSNSNYICEAGCSIGHNTVAFNAFNVSGYTSDYGRMSKNKGKCVDFQNNYPERLPDGSIELLAEYSAWQYYNRKKAEKIEKIKKAIKADPSAEGIKKALEYYDLFFHENKIDKEEFVKNTLEE